MRYEDARDVVADLAVSRQVERESVLRVEILELPLREVHVNAFGFLAIFELAAGFHPPLEDVIGILHELLLACVEDCGGLHRGARQAVEPELELSVRLSA